MLDVDKLLTVRELASVLGVTAQTIRTWAKIGYIPAIKVGRGWRFDGEKVMEAIKRENNVRKLH